MYSRNYGYERSGPGDRTGGRHGRFRAGYGGWRLSAGSAYKGEKKLRVRKAAGNRGAFSPPDGTFVRGRISERMRRLRSGPVGLSGAAGAEGKTGEGQALPPGRLGCANRKSNLRYGRSLSLPQQSPVSCKHGRRDYQEGRNCESGRRSSGGLFSRKEP